MILKSLHWIEKNQWVLLVFAAPFLLFPSPNTIWVMLVFPFIWGVQAIVRHTPIDKTPLNLTLLIFSISILLSVFVTYDLETSLPKITGLLFGLSVYFLVIRKTSSFKSWYGGISLFLLAGVGIALISLWGTNWENIKFLTLNQITIQFPYQLRDIPGALQGFQPNEVGGALLWVIPVLLTLSVSGLLLFKPLQRLTGWFLSILINLMLWISLFFTLAVFILTQSRTSYVALAVAIFAMLWVIFPRWLKWLSGILSLIAITAVIVVFTNHNYSLLLMNYLPDGLFNLQAFSVSTLIGRFEIWYRALLAQQDFPLTGTGLNTFRYLSHWLYPYTNAPGELQRDLGHAHNEFLQAALDLGLPGLISFCAIQIGVAWMWLKSWRILNRFSARVTRQPSSDLLKITKSTLLGLGGGFFAHFLYGWIDAISLGAKPGFLFWLLAGLIASILILLQRIRISGSINDI